jgi:hypothetical protein
MVYKATVPASGDFISQSQIDFQANFDTASNIWGRPFADNEGDHIPLNFSDVDKRGGHRKVTFVQQGAAPSTGANEIALYSKNVSSNAEAFYRQPSDGTEVQVTDQGRLTANGLVLRAFVLFDFQGNILQQQQVNGDGTIVKVPISMNVTSVTPNQALVNGINKYSDWNIAFTNALPTADYVWACQSFNIGGNNSPVYMQPRNNAAYASTVTTTSFALRGMPMSSSSTGAQTNAIYIQFQAWTVT